MAELRARGDAFDEVDELFAYGPVRRLQRLDTSAASDDVEAPKRAEQWSVMARMGTNWSRTVKPA